MTKNLIPYPKRIKDHSVSGSYFELSEHVDYGFLCTTPQPSIEELPSYYQSEDYISHTNRSKNWMELLYHKVRSFNLKNKRNYLNELELDGKKLLDFGCGTGHFAIEMQRNNWEVSAYEPNQNAREIAISMGVNAKEPSQFWTDSSRYNLITLWHVLEHLPDLENHIGQFYKLLTQNGKLVIAVPNFLSWDAQYYRDFWAAYDVPRHLWHFSPESIKKLFLQHGFKCVDTKPMFFDAYYVSLLSEQYKTGYKNVFRALYNGFRSNRRAKATGNYSSLIYVFEKV